MSNISDATIKRKRSPLTESQSSHYLRRRPIVTSVPEASVVMVPKAHTVTSPNTDIENDADGYGSHMRNKPSSHTYHDVDNEHPSHSKKFQQEETVAFEIYSDSTDTQDSNLDGQMYVQLRTGTGTGTLQTEVPNSEKNLDCMILEFDEDDNINCSDTTSLLKQTRLTKAKKSDVHISDERTGDKNSSDTKQIESVWSLGLQTLFPFLMAGIGMVAAGIVLDLVQHWEVFEKVPEIFILVPALLGLKGNLEMTLASRLSTYANRGYLDDASKRWKIIWGNMVLVEAQAMVVAFLASLVAMVLGWIPDGKWETNHAIILCTGSLLTGAIASGLLGVIMILVIVLSKKLGINPDNVATPIAAALGDLITLTLLSIIVKGFYVILYNPSSAWIGPAVIAFFILLTPLVLWLAHRNEFSRDVVKHGWTPVIAAMGISSAGGFILDFAVSHNPGIAVFSPVINGVGGNLVAVQASRISTYLHTSGHPLGSLPESDKPGCVSPWKIFFGSNNQHAVGARVLLSLVVPGQLLFVLIIQALKAGHTTISPQFVFVYILVSLIQVAILLQVCNCMVLRLWRNGDDPDNSAIPYLTALGDLLGTGLLSAGFVFLWLVGDRDMDVGD